MLSGVGPASHLSEHGIPVVADLSGVGSHLMDHLVVDLHFKDTSNTGLWFLKGSGFSAKMKLIKALDRKSTRLNSSHSGESRMPSSA